MCNFPTHSPITIRLDVNGLHILPLFRDHKPIIEEAMKWSLDIIPV